MGDSSLRSTCTRPRDILTITFVALTMHRDSGGTPWRAASPLQTREGLRRAHLLSIVTVTNNASGLTVQRRLVSCNDAPVMLFRRSIQRYLRSLHYLKNLSRMLLRCFTRMWVYVS